MISQKYFREFKVLKLTFWERVRLFLRPVQCFYDDESGMWNLFKEMDGKYYYISQGRPLGMIKGIK